MNEKTENQNRHDHALAQLLVHAPTNNSCGDGASVSLEELVMLNEGTLSEQRRQEVIGQLDSKPLLYETWLASQELAQLAETPITGSTPEVEAISHSKTSVKPSVRSSMDKMGQLVRDLFSWQSALAASFGLVMGVILVSQYGLDNSVVPDDSLAIVINAPLELPQKASVESAYNQTDLSSITPQITHVEVVRIDGNSVHLKLTLKSGEEILKTYVYQQNRH